MFAQEFDANEFHKNNSTSYAVQVRHKTGIITSLSQGFVVLTDEMTNIYNPNWLGAGWFSKIFPFLGQR